MRISRRGFVGRSAITMVGVGLGSPLLRGFEARAAGRRAPGRTAATAPANKRVLVVVNLDGGNDGLNTVVPLHQYRASPRSSHPPALVLGYGALTPETAERGVRLLAEATAG